ncbi:MAG: hypothetical protein WCC14_04380 [Acidobacteriaceae bacterium]
MQTLELLLLFTVWAAAYGQSAPSPTSVGSQSYPTYSDNFQRANGKLGSNWKTPKNANPLRIISDNVYAATVPVTHALEYYSAATFANNQWSSYTIVKTGPGNSATSAMVRANGNTPTEFYNDGPQRSMERIGIATPTAEPTDFCSIQLYTAMNAGDTDELAVAGSGPVFFWILRNGVIDGTCYDDTYDYTGGNPGLGLAADNNATPTAAAGNWQGGSLPDFSTTPSDDFQRANAGWLGVNWWYPEPGGGFTQAFTLNGNAAALTGSGIGMAVWTTPFSLNQSSAVTVGSTAGDTWIGAVTRYTLVSSGNETFYFALVQPNGVVDLFAYDGTKRDGVWERLGSSLGIYSGTVRTIELDASGTSPVLLTVRINGKQFGRTYSDSIYKLTGTYAGFIVDGTASTTVSGWTGKNL